MVFVFGIEMPLLEMIFILTLILILLIGLLVYIILSERSINKALKRIVVEENKELKGIKDIQKEEKGEIELLKYFRTELDKLLHSMSPSKKIQDLIKNKKKTEERIIKLKDKLKELEDEKQKTLCPRCHTQMHRGGKIKQGPRGGLRRIYVCPECNYRRMRDENIKET